MRPSLSSERQVCRELLRAECGCSDGNGYEFWEEKGKRVVSRISEIKPNTYDKKLQIVGTVN